MKSLIIFILVFLSVGIKVSAQDCSDFHQFQCVYSDYTFFYSRQSKSAVMTPGQISALNMVAYGGEEYYIALCAHRKLGIIQFKILLDNDERTVIYNSAEDENASSITFSNEITRNLIVEISVPEGSDETGRCVGVLIQFKESETAK